MKRLAVALFAAALLGGPGLVAPAIAHTALEKSDPAPGAKLDKVAKITLRFSGTLQPARSGATLVGPSGKALAVATAVGMTQITLLPFQLRPGHYHVDWHSEGQDASKAKGTLAFTVTAAKTGPKTSTAKK